MASFNDIQIISQPQDISSLSFELISGVKEAIDCCFDQKGLLFILENKLLYEAIISVRNSGSIRSRLVTEITQENTYFCNLMMKNGGNVFHSDKVNGNFLIIDEKKYLCYLTNDEENKDQNIAQVMYTKTKSFVNTQQYLFDCLCSKGIPAREKIRELVRGIRGDFIDNIEDPSEIHKIESDVLKSATYEILLLYSTINSFYREEYNGILNLLWDASERGVSIKILIQTDDDTAAETIQKKVRQNRLPINIQYIRKPLQTKITTLVVDQTISLAIEINDDTKKTFEESTGIAIYSNNESTVSSCLSIFETLWIQSEFDKQNKVKRAYFQMFKDFKLKDEVYSRRWTSEAKKTKEKHNS